MHSVRREKRVVSRKNQVFLSIAKKIIADRIVRSRWRWEERETEIVPKRITFVSVELFQKLCLQTITQLIVTPTWKMITAWLWLIPDTRLIRTPSSHKASSLMGQWRIERWDANELGLFCQQLDKSKLFTLYVLAIDGSFLKPNSQLKTVSFERLRLQFFLEPPLWTTIQQNDKRTDQRSRRDERPIQIDGSVNWPGVPRSTVTLPSRYLVRPSSPWPGRGFHLGTDSRLIGSREWTRGKTKGSWGGLKKKNFRVRFYPLRRRAGSG